MSLRYPIIQAAGIALLAVIGAAVAGVPVPLEKVPAPVLKAVKDKFPKATVKSADKEGADKDGKERFELVMKEGDRKFDVGVLADGKILNVKEEIAEDKIPEAVKKGLEKKYPGAKILEAEKITTGEGDKAKVTYELVIKTDKDQHSVEFDVTGKLIGMPE